MRRLLVTTGLGALGVGFVGFLHLPAARPLLHFLGVGHCPVGMDRSLSAAQADAARDKALAFERGTEPARSRPALAFDLDRTTRDDVRAWAAAAGTTCAAERDNLRCRAVPAAAVGIGHDVDELFLAFDDHDRLVGVSASVGSLGADEAVGLYDDVSAAVAQKAGPPSATRGQADASWLGSGDLDQAATSFRFTDYRADVTATNLGRGRIGWRATFEAG